MNPIENGQKKEPNKLKRKFSLTFPWWFKILAYALALVISGVALFFVIVVGIEFGDVKVSQWLTSLVVSVLTSIFISHPLQVRYKLISFDFLKRTVFTKYSISDCFARAIGRFYFAKSR